MQSGKSDGALLVQVEQGSQCTDRCTHDDGGSHDHIAGLGVGGVSSVTAAGNGRTGDQNVNVEGFFGHLQIVAGINALALHDLLPIFFVVNLHAADGEILANYSTNFATADDITDLLAFEEDHAFVVVGTVGMDIDIYQILIGVGIDINSSTFTQSCSGFKCMIGFGGSIDMTGPIIILAIVVHQHVVDLITTVRDELMDQSVFGKILIGGQQTGLGLNISSVQVDPDFQIRIAGPSFGLCVDIVVITVGLVLGTLDFGLSADSAGVAVIAGVLVTQSTTGKGAGSVAGTGMSLLQDTAGSHGAGNAALTSMTVSQSAAILIALGLQTTLVVGTEDSGIIGTVGGTITVVNAVGDMLSGFLAELTMLAKCTYAIYIIMCIGIFRKGVVFAVLIVQCADTRFNTGFGTAGCLNGCPFTPAVSSRVDR